MKIRALWRNTSWWDRTALFILIVGFALALYSWFSPSEVTAFFSQRAVFFTLITGLIVFGLWYKGVRRKFIGEFFQALAGVAMIFLTINIAYNTEIQAREHRPLIDISAGLVDGRKVSFRFENTGKLSSKRGSGILAVYGSDGGTVTPKPIATSKFPLGYLAPKRAIEVSIEWAGMGPDNQVRYFVAAAWRYQDDVGQKARIDEARDEFFLYEEQRDEKKVLHGIKWMLEALAFINPSEQRQMVERMQALRDGLQSD